MRASSAQSNSPLDDTSPHPGRDNVCAPPPAPDNNPCTDCQTRHVCIASRLPEQSLQHLPGWMRISQVFSPGVALYRAGDPSGRQFHVRSGMFKTSVVNAQGEEFVTGFHLPGDVIGRVCHDGAYVESAVAVETSTVCELDIKTLEANGRHAVALMSALVSNMADQARQDLQHHSTLSQTSAQVRFAAFCVRFADKLHALGRCEQFLPTPMSRTDLANYLGMTLESLSRVISKMNAQGLIRAARDHIDLCRLPELRALAAQALL